jgi:FkbM family methyltransferase
VPGYLSFPELLLEDPSVTKVYSKEHTLLEKLKHFVFPENPVDGRALSRFKRGAIHYAHTGGRSAIPPMQRWLRRQSFTFRHGLNGASTKVKLSAGDLTHLWVADEVLAEGVYQFAAVPFIPELVLDLGANIGLFTLLAARHWPRAQFICVEPHPTTFSFLTANLDLNGVRAIKLQCAIDSQPRIMYLCNDGAVYQALSAEPTAVAALTVPLDAVLPAAQRLVIKMDIEGAEQNALGSLTTALPEETFIFIELHRGADSLRWVELWALDRGFVFTEVRRRDDAIDGFLARRRM